MDHELVLRELELFAGTASEKLRWFAIWLEEDVVPHWTVVSGLYAEAVRRDPMDPRLRYSWALAAYNYADFVPESDRASMIHDAARLAEDAVRAAPDDPYAHYVLGLALYDDETRPVADAEREFRRAVELRPGFAAARLYLGHALQDLGRWDEALTEMQAVSDEGLMAEFGSLQRWRVAKLREQVAVCLLRLGRIAEAEHATEEFLHIAEQAEPSDLQPPEQLLELASLVPERMAARIRRVASEDRRDSRC